MSEREHSGEYRQLEQAIAALEALADLQKDKEE